MVLTRNELLSMRVLRRNNSRTLHTVLEAEAIGWGRWVVDDLGRIIPALHHIGVSERDNLRVTSARNEYG